MSQYQISARGVFSLVEVSSDEAVQRRCQPGHAARAAGLQDQEQQGGDEHAEAEAGGLAVDERGQEEGGRQGVKGLPIKDFTPCSSRGARWSCCGTGEVMNNCDAHHQTDRPAHDQIFGMSRVQDEVDQPKQGYSVGTLLCPTANTSEHPQEEKNQGKQSTPDRGPFGTHGARNSQAQVCDGSYSQEEHSEYHQGHCEDGDWLPTSEAMPPSLNEGGSHERTCLRPKGALHDAETLPPKS
mmetsp:Transcript_47729/g.102283  ORF Transcript_47729/g.102283 Transcript_47729/m.102283 type:complete len:240 (+) Transcript_47729:522-1241(+)